MTLVLALDIVLLIVAGPVLLASAYLTLATLLSAAPAPPLASQPARRFRFVVPAHNESAGIAETVASLRSVDYPAELFDIVVVADNCSDDTAEKARGAGATVMVRNDPVNRGKGYALDHAFSATSADVDAVVVIDADTLVSNNLLRVFDALRGAGANAVQADYAVRNPDGSWRTRLMAVALGSFHVLRSRARERLGLSCGLRGNGMCFSTQVLREIPHHAYSVVEDVEYGIRLAEAGQRVYYADAAHVYGEMVTTSAAADSQRRRWEEGRKQLVRQHAFRLLKKGLGQRSKLLTDLAMDLLIPPLSRIAVGLLLVWVVALTLAVALHAPGVSLLASSLGLSGVVAYVLRGWSLSGTGARGLRDLLLAPAYVFWKLTLRFRRPARATSDWVRTAREKPPS